MKPLTLLIFATLAAAPAVAHAEDPPLPANGPCSVKGVCRYVDSLNIKLLNGQSVQQKVGAYVPWIAPTGEVVLFPGDAVVVRMEPKDAGLTPVLVEAGAFADRPLAAEEVRFDFAQDDKGFTNLKTTNHLAKSMHFNSVINKGGGKVEPSSICALLPGVFSYENWQGPLIQIVLRQFSAVDRMGCWSDPPPSGQSVAPPTPPR
jgi:hypothetical protein